MVREVTKPDSHLSPNLGPELAPSPRPRRGRLPGFVGPFPPPLWIRVANRIQLLG